MKILEFHCDQLSDFMLMVFYIIIGISSRLTDIVTVGAPALLLIGVALSTHLATIGVGSLIWNYVSKNQTWIDRKYLTIDVDTAVVAR